jgi:hypothetical protein
MHFIFLFCIQFTDDHYKFEAAETYMNTNGESIDNARLIISSVDFDDEGEYKCWAASTRYANTNATQAILVRVKGMHCSCLSSVSFGFLYS